MTRQLNINLKGRIQKVKASDPLLPLFEAVTNSIQAIEELDQTDGKVLVELVRGTENGSLKLEERNPIIGFVITDNGIGFNEANIQSFCTSDSQYKANKGAKGVGRFTWLKFFPKVEVNSHFCDADGTKKRRSFFFTFDGVEDELQENSSEKSNKTTVKMTDLKFEFKDKLSPDMDNVTNSLLEHFLSYFATKSSPIITVKDGGEIRL